MTCSGRKCSLEHATHGRYSHGCRCDECRSAHSAYESQRLRNRLGKHGHGYLDAAPFTEIFGALFRQGYDFAALAEVCGVNQHTVRRLVFGETRYVQRGTAAKLRIALELLPSEGSKA